MLKFVFLEYDAGYFAGETLTFRKSLLSLISSQKNGYILPIFSPEE